MSRKLVAEFFGTWWLVFGGCGTAVTAAAFPQPGVGLPGVALAFGLTVLTMVYAVGPISGGHFNPAVTVGLAAGGRFPAGEVPGYVIARLAGAIVTAAILAAIATGKPGFDLVASGFAANGFGDHSPGKYALGAALLIETVMTFFFVFVIMGAASKAAPAGFAGIAIGLTLTLVHLVTIPVTNTPVNPARSASQALFVVGRALQQLWAFRVAPIAGGIIAGIVGRSLLREGTDARDAGGAIPMTEGEPA